MATAQFEGIYLGLLSVPGKLRIAASGLGWKSTDETVPVTTVPAADIKWIQWIRVARNFQLLLGTTGANGKTRITFDGFLRDDLERLQNLCKQYYNTTIEPKETSVKGWNWGVAEVQGQDLVFANASKPAFTIPLALVHNTSITRTEVAIEFSSSVPPAPVNEEGADRKRRMKITPDEITEIKLYIPGSAKTAKKRAEKSASAEPSEKKSDAEESDDDIGGETAAQLFHDSIKEIAEVSLVVGEILCTISDVLCLTPRGRFDIDMYADFFRLRGKTYDYRIAYDQCQKMYLLPKPDDIHCQVVINIDPPIRQGQTRYPYLVMQFVKEDIMTVDVNVDEETIKEKYDGALKARYDDPAHEVVSILFRVLAGKKITTPGNYQAHDGQAAVKCNVKTNEGQLYFLEKQLLFISKQPAAVPHSDISSVTFARVGGVLGSARTFDLVIKLRSSSTSENITFAALQKEELEGIEDFLKMKKIKCKNETEEIAKATAAILGAEGSDDDMGAIMGVGEEMDEGSEEDQDFQASSGEESGGSGSGSGDSDAGEDNDEKMDLDNDDEEPEKKKPKTS